MCEYSRTLGPRGILSNINANLRIRRPMSRGPWRLERCIGYIPIPKGRGYPYPNPPRGPPSSGPIVFDRFRSFPILLDLPPRPLDLLQDPPDRSSKSAPPFFTAPGRYFRVHCSMLTPKRPQRGLKRWPRSTPSIAKIGTPSRRETFFP